MANGARSQVQGESYVWANVFIDPGVVLTGPFSGACDPSIVWCLSGCRANGCYPLQSHLRFAEFGLFIDTFHCSAPGFKVANPLIFYTQIRPMYVTQKPHSRKCIDRPRTAASL
jgi:hypothetical protein